MLDADFKFVSGLLKERSGLIIGPDKIYLLESRLAPIARKEGLKSVDDLIGQLRNKPNEGLFADVTEAMTTNESLFFRDKTPFDNLKDHILPSLMESRPPTHKTRVWCAAASTGQEPYSITILLKENEAKFGKMKCEIIGTDISSQVLQKAKAGIYSQFEIQRGMPIQLLIKYFEQKDEHWVVKPELKTMVKFREFNLLDDFKVLGKWDVVFCRNVLIYFDQPTKADILNRIAECLAPDGYLVLGAAETVLGISAAFEPIKGRRGLYKRVDAEDKAEQPTAPPLRAAAG